MEKRETNITVPFKVEINQDLSWGRLTRFARELRDNQRIMGAKCPNCGIVWCPPVADCIKCYVQNEWIAVGPRGNVQTYTTCYMPPAIEGKLIPIEIPYTIALIKLDGADTGMLHYLREIDPRNVKVGLRVEPVFKPTREGRITDIHYFRPIKN